jgi:N-formylglutamate amidohydrolase
MAPRSKTTGDSRIENGGFIAGSDSPAFTLTIPRRQPIPVLIAVPHAGRIYPPEILGTMREPEYCSIRLEDRFVDALASEVARETGAALLVAHAPRAMLDLNRAQDDVDWGMVSGSKPARPPHSQANRRARSGLGLVPRRLHGFGEIWKGHLSQAELDQRIEGIHRPYHATLGRTLEEIRDVWGSALLLDFHSMPPLKGQHGGGPVPQFVIGDRFGASCDGNLQARALGFFDAQGRPAAHNRPYSGGYVLDRHAAPARGLHAMQLEICRSIYLDKRMAQPATSLAPVARLLSSLVRELGAVTARLADSGHIPLAAE